jgi:predicted esterase
MRFRVTLAVAAVGVAAFVPGAAGLPSSQIISEVDLGHGASETWVYLPEGAPSCAVVFLHGAGDLTPAAYRAWLSYLAIGMRCAVIYPQYQATVAVAPLSSASLRGLRAGVAASFAYLRTARFGLYRDPLPKHFPVVVAGYASGGVLALYVASNAKRWGVPVPVAVDSIFPVEGRIPGVPLAPLAAGTRVLIQAGDRDKAGGLAAARSLWQSLASHPAGRKRLQVVHSAPGFSAVHNAPRQATTAATSFFWDPLDALIDAATGG